MNKVKAYRKKVRLSRRELAKRTGLSVSNICFIETGKVVAKLSDACKIADVLNRSLDDLFPPFIISKE
ncbi:helix-turn-helix transcriptional regulator [Desulfitibacter alkalitolerans]|uniref:helix-turn-helix transcriptional regulator n=1 Tax=Desulfitibacter alkalitolerans TaxID=264641 RepID=UPI000557A9E9|nr:helix-turn-helix transcriptional regulator [Desulfitibacter alkalitolerans]